MKNLTYYAEWLEHDGRTVKIDGHAHVLKVRTMRAVYPYERDVISVYAEPKNRNSRWYLEIAAKVGPDWATDVLEMELEEYVAVLRQVRG